MIVISGALILIALVLLVLGIIVSPGILFAAIGLAIVSAGFLLYGVITGGGPAADDDEHDRPAGKGSRDSRDDDGDDKADAGSGDVTVHKQTASKSSSGDDENGTRDDPAEREGRGRQAAAGAAAAGVAAEAAHWSGRGDDAGPDADDQAPADRQYDQDDLPEEGVPAGAVAAAQQSGKDVFVVSGHPRFHTERCPAVGRDDDIEDIELVEAIELGFTPCGVCRPLATLGGTKAPAAGHRDEDPRARRPSDETRSDETPSDETPSEEARSEAAPAAVAAERQPAEEHREAVRSWSSGSAWSGTAAAMGGPAANGGRQASNGSAPAPAGEAVPEQPQAARDEPQTQQLAPSAAGDGHESQPEPAEDPTPTGAVVAGGSRTSTRSRTVLASAATREYHREGCDVADGHGLEEMSKVAAIRKGYLACGACRP